MADSNNSMQEFLNALGNLTRGLDASVYEINDLVQKVKRQSKDFPDLIKELAKSVDNATDENIEAVKKLKANEERINKLNQQIELYNKLLKDNTDDEKKLFEDKLKKLEEQLKDEQDLSEALQHGKEEELNVRKDIVDTLQKAKKDEEETRDKNQKELEETRKKNAESFLNAATNILSIFTDKFSKAVDNVVQSYEQNAGKLSAALNLTVDDISDMQRDIAANLRSSNLGSVISNIAVLNEASNLVSAGYSDVSTLSENATAIARAREVAPGLNLDSGTIKNLTNVFGSDFIDRFSAIQTAVQSTAGSTVGLKEGLNKMMTDLEPVYLNAQYSINALQATADVENTLTLARSQYNLSESDVDRLRNSLVELMDPNKAFSSSNTAIRMAASQYGQQIWETGDVSLALEAIMRSQGTLLDNLGNSSNMNAMLYANALGNWNTLSYGYNRPNIENFVNSPIVRLGDLERYAQEDTRALESKAYTTRSEAEQTYAENMELTQQVAKIAENSPLLYDNVGKIANLVGSIYSVLVSGLFTSGGNANGLISSGINGVKSIINDSTLGSALNRAGSTALGKVGFGLGGATSAILTAKDVINDINNDNFSIGSLFSHGDYLSSIARYGSMGAAIGSFIPGGTAVGAVAGVAIGSIGALISNLTKSTEENTEATKEGTEATTKNTYSLSQAVDAVDVMERNQELFARGSGLVSFKNGTTAEIVSNMPGYASGLDYVPYDDYAVRLHKGEAVISAKAAEELRKQNPNFWNDTFNGTDTVVDALKEQTESIVSAVRGDIGYSPLTKAGPKQYVIKNNQ